MDLSVIIPTHNRERSLRRALASVFRQTLGCGRYEVIVVDNASTDGTADAVAEFQAQRGDRILRFVREERIGLHNARHAGAHAARGNVLVFTDDDATFDPGWCTGYAAAFSRHPEMMAAGGPVRPVWETEPPDWLLEYVGQSRMVNILSIMEPFDEFRIDRRGVFFGVNMAIRRRALFALGGFNPELFGSRWLGDGETGLNRKLIQQGALIGYVPDAVVYHHIPPERMTVEYFRRRMANQAACDAYTYYHHGIPPWPRLLRTMAGISLRNAGCWLRALLLRDRTDRDALNVQLHSARTQARVIYLARLIYDRQLRELVLKKNWLKDAAVFALALGPSLEHL